MIEKNEETVDNDNNLVRIRLIADKRKYLEDRSSQVQEEIRACFAHLAQALHAREKQLLRQAEAIYRQQISLALSCQEFLPPSVAVLDERESLEEQIRTFGRIELRGSNSNAITNLEPYKIEEYQDTDKDHVSFDKAIQNDEAIPLSCKVEGSPTTEDQDEDNLSPRSDTESQRNEFDCMTVTDDDQDDKDPKKTRGNLTEERHSSCGHPEQVQQWLEQILLETEVEPTINEVEKLPEIAEACICAKLQVQT